jgi:poly-gamma-glutamate biosynthesis protein PgsC/CapC
MDALPLAIGIGLATTLLFTELFGIAAGGMIVPGYLALSLTRPLDVALTIGAGFVTFAIVHTLSSFTILYGRRRTVLTILVGYLIAMLIRWSTSSFVPVNNLEFQLVGFVVPGLIALWLDRQGVIETLAALVTASAFVRLVLICTGVELLT